VSDPFPPTPADDPAGDYTQLPYWRELLDRAARNAVQALLPTLLVLASGTAAGINTAAVLWTVGIAGVVTVLKALLVTPPKAGATTWRRLLDRAVPAAAAAALSYATIDGTTPVADLDWSAAWLGVAGSALLAIGQAYASPPARTGHTLAA
jgi:hypothetical protein